MLVHELVERQATRTPGSLAVTSPDEQVTYGELLRRAHRLSRSLEAEGLCPEHPVGICLPRGPQTVTAMLGVLAGGGAVLPVDPATPAPLVRRLLTGSSAASCLTEVPVHLSEPNTAVPVRSSRAVSPTSIATVHATEVSTVETTHQAWIDGVRRAQRLCPLAPGETVLHTAPPVSPALVVEVIWPLAVGARVAAVEAPDPVRLLRACRRHHASVMTVTAQALDELLDLHRRHGRMPLPWLRHVICVGPPATAAVVRRFEDQFGGQGCRLHHAVVLDEALRIAPNRERVARKRVVRRDAVTSDESVTAAVASMWAAVLDVEGVGPHDNFFALGGHSMHATRLYALLRKRFGVRVPLTVLFGHPTLADFSDQLVKALPPGRPGDVVPA